MKAEVEERVVQRKGVARAVASAGEGGWGSLDGRTYKFHPWPGSGARRSIVLATGSPQPPLPGCPTNSGLSWVGNPTPSEALPRSLFLPLFSCGAPENVESPSQHILCWRLALRGRPRMESWFLLFIHCAILGKLLTPTPLSFLICKMGTTPPSLTGAVVRLEVAGVCRIQQCLAGWGPFCVSAPTSSFVPVLTDLSLTVFDKYLYTTKC